MASHSEIVNRWAQVAAAGKGRLLSPRSNVFPSADGSTIYSYGHHFALGEVMGKPGSRWFLLNGDSYSVSTTRHQSYVRDAVKSTGLPSMTVPFTALREAGIHPGSITPVEILPDSFETTTHTAASLSEVPESRRPVWHEDGTWLRYTERGHLAAIELADGTWQWETSRHWLGSAVFSASYSYTDREARDADGYRTYPTRTGTAYFLSAFDENEPRPLYFLAQLPEGAEPQTYAEAIELLKPMVVADAEAQGTTVLRQGDVFAIETTRTTRELRKAALSVTLNRPRSKPGYFVLGVGHAVTEVIVTAEGTYARGIMRHVPDRGRAPDHRNVKLGDRRSWYLIAKNTVPEDRSWSMGGNVD